MQIFCASLTPFFNWYLSNGSTLFYAVFYAWSLQAGSTDTPYCNWIIFKENTWHRNWCSWKQEAGILPRTSQKHNNLSCKLLHIATAPYSWFPMSHDLEVYLEVQTMRLLFWVHKSLPTIINLFNVCELAPALLLLPVTLEAFFLVLLYVSIEKLLKQALEIHLYCILNTVLIIGITWIVEMWKWLWLCRPGVDCDCGDIT